MYDVVFRRMTNSGKISKRDKEVYQLLLKSSQIKDYNFSNYEPLNFIRFSGFITKNAMDTLYHDYSDKFKYENHYGTMGLEKLTIDKFMNDKSKDYTISFEYGALKILLIK